MIASTPIPFAEAIKLLTAKQLLPTTASAAELETIASDLRRMAMFSARVTDAGFLQRASDLINQVVAPGTQAGSYMDKATFRERMKSLLDSLGYNPEPGTEGGLKDLRSDGRLNLILDTNASMARGYGQYLQSTDTDVLDAFPAFELYRAGNFMSKKQRDWPTKWRNAWYASGHSGGGLVGGGRMIATKDDPIWTLSLDDGGFNRFGNPYPPFDYNSGMRTRDISRSEAIELGIIEDKQVIAPERVRLTDSLSADVSGISKPLVQSIIESMGSTAKLIDGILHLVS